MTYRSLETIARKHGRHGQNLQPRFTRTDSLFQVKTWVIFRDIIRYSKYIFGDFYKNYIAELCGRMLFSDFRSAVRSFIVLRHFFTEFDRFLLVLSKQLCLVVKTTVLCCLPGCGGSMTSITTAYYAIINLEGPPKKTNSDNQPTICLLSYYCFCAIGFDFSLYYVLRWKFF